MSLPISYKSRFCGLGSIISRGRGGGGKGVMHQKVAFNAYLGGMGRQLRI
jgi:hypothetical protein